MDTLSTRNLPYSSVDQFQNIRVSDNGFNIGCDVMVRLHSPVYHNIRDEEGSDTDTDSLEGMPEGWHAAQSPENDTYYVSPINPDTGAWMTTWIKPMPGWAPADVSFREELERKFKAALQPGSEKLNRANAGEPSPTTPGEGYYAKIEACASRLGALWPSKKDMF
jgi:hypothetical protein